MKIEIVRITNGFLVTYDFGGIWNSGDCFFKTKGDAVAYSKRLLNSYREGKR